MTAIVKLVWDGTGEVRVPSEMGTPRADQMQGTALEQLAELAGRVCYDSLGKGRSSGDYHKHIAEVRHGSVLEHGYFTVEAESDHLDDYILSECLNRPGLWVRRISPTRARLTVNLRAALEWWRRDGSIGRIGYQLVGAAALHAPVIEREYASPERTDVTGIQLRHVEPETDDEKWITLFIGNVSRGLSHELVRHGDWTGISQRSTRYVDESESPWVEHPVERAFWEWLNPIVPRDFPQWFRDCDVAISRVTDGDGVVDVRIPESVNRYDFCVKLFEAFLLHEKGVDKLNARKQARGAARGYLGNALATELIFSASVAQWKRILDQRGSGFADAEVRAMAVDALREFRRSRYADCFGAYTVSPSPDKIGEVVQRVDREIPC